MATFTVTTAADVVNPGDGVLSLREAAQRANATEAADTIVFANALEGRTLTLTRGQLNLTNDVAVDGAGGTAPRHDRGEGQPRRGGPGGTTPAAESS